VVEVLFRADLAEGTPPLYAGQVVDVYIEAGERGASAETAHAFGASGS
jgi:hypothetical protein